MVKELSNYSEDPKIVKLQEKSRIKTEKLEARKKEKEKTIKISIGEVEYSVPKTMVFEEGKKEFNIKENTKKIANGEVAVLLLRESSMGELKYVRPENGMFIVSGRYYHSNEACIFNIGKKRIPLAVIPEWSFVPLTRKDYSAKLAAGSAEAQALIIKSIENAEVVKINQDVNPKSKADGKLIIWIIIGGVIGLFFLNKMFGGA